MNQENQNVEHKRIWKDEYLKWVSGFANAHGGKIYIGIDDDLTVFGVEKAFDNANLKRPEFTVEQGGVTAMIYREIFMSVRGDQQPNQNRAKTDIEPIQTDTKPN